VSTQSRLHTHRTSRPLLPYIPGLDGLRAIAVVAVLLYHGQDLTGIPAFLKPQGGFLGVEMFFVISGFLITALLVREQQATERIDLQGFWIRRARRLLPALYLFLLGTIALAALFATGAFDKVRTEIFGALFYVSNWQLIATDESYFETAGRPSLFRHLWSLAIEEQFYLVWPLIVLVGLRYGGRRALLALTLAGVAASTALLWWLFDGIDQYGDVTTVYFRTDARAAALLLGSALALVWQPSANDTGWMPTGISCWIVDATGAAALALVVLMNYSFTDRVIEWAAYTRLYHGGFLALSVSTAIVIAAVSVPNSRLGSVLGNPVMRWIGMRSYGIYLWHWPVFQLTRPRVDVDIDGYPLLLIRLAITMGLVELSYRLIELPIRERRFWSAALATIRTPRGIGFATAGALGLIMATTAVAVAIPSIDRSPVTQVAANLDVTNTARGVDLAAPVAVTTPVVTPAPAPTPTVSARAAALIAGDFDPLDLIQPTPVPTPTQPPLPPPPPLSAPFDITASQIHIVGDSVVEGAQSQLYRIAPQVTVDGRIGRQWWELEAEIRAMRAQGLANDVVVIQLGNNGNFTTPMFDGVMNSLAGTRLVLFVNVHAPVVWESEVNAMLVRNVNRYAENARLIDWYTASTPHPEYFIDDGTHLQGPGMVAFRYLIENALLSLS
jgi:peptidoglycan/LPS O-acetylase OafA/YrhL